MHSIRTKILDAVSGSRIDHWTSFIMKSQWCSEKQIEEFQEYHFHRLVDHVFANSPFYQKYFEHQNIRREDIRSLEDIDKFPIMRREDVREHLDDLIAVNKDQFKPSKRSTGGTTGTPLVYFSDKESWSMGWALKLRDWSYSGYRLGEKMGIFAGGSLIPDQGFNLKRTIWNEITGFKPFPMAHYNDDTFKEASLKIRKSKIQYLRGYPTSLLSFAEYVLRKEEKMPMKAIFTTAEVLQADHRKLIERAFEAKVFDQYGCADSGGHASECGHDPGYHLSFESAYGEFINKEVNFDGEEIVELVFTNWHNYAMPVLRYAPGDLASLDSNDACSCGRTTPKLKRIIGRTTERIKFANGNILAGPAFTLFFRLFKLKSYQLQQIDELGIQVNLVPDLGFEDDDLEEIRRNISHHAGPEVKINIQILESIAPSASGKHKFIIALKN